MLRPGIHVLRRRDGQVQVGLDRSRAVVLPDNAEVREGLRRLGTAEAAGAPGADGSLLRRLAPLLTTPVEPTRARVAVTTFGHPVGGWLGPRLHDLVAASGLETGTNVVDVAVIAGVGEPTRELSDRWTWAGTPHLLLRLVEGYAVVGPFVVPGVTACLRCLDAHATDDDPSWPLLVEQYSALSARDRPDGASESVDPLLAELACAWAVRDLASYVRGHRPSTWSTTLRLDPLLRDLTTTSWPRHPMCGCTWTMDP